MRVVTRSADDGAPVNRMAVRQAELGLDVKWGNWQICGSQPNLQHQLCRGRGGPTAGEPHSILPLLPREAGVLPRQRRHLRVRPSGSGRVRANADKISGFQKKQAKIVENEKLGIISIDGTVLVPTKYDKIVRLGYGGAKMELQ